MPRTARLAPGGLVYHVLNRGVGRMALFETPADYAAFCRVVRDVHAAAPFRLLGYCLMPNHWHLVLWPAADGQLARFMQRLTITHVRRWVEFRGRVGWGSVYQGRFKSFAVEPADAHFRAVVRYVERNPLRANLVARAEAWPWSSLGQAAALAADPGHPALPLAAWPVDRPRNWADVVNRAQSAPEEAALRRALDHGRPFGTDRWVAQTEAALRLPPLRPVGRPKKPSAATAR